MTGNRAPMTDEVHAASVATSTGVAAASLEELLAFERLLGDLSVQFANIFGEQIETKIAGALKQLIEFLGFDRSTFAEFTADGWLSVSCSVAVEGVEPFPSGPLPAFASWYVDEVRAGKIVIVRTLDDLPPEAIGVAEHFRRSGLRSQLGIPLSIDGSVVAVIAFGAFRSTRAWPDELIARLKIVGGVIAQALSRKRSEAALRASEERWRLAFEFQPWAYSLQAKTSGTWRRMRHFSPCSATRKRRFGNSRLSTSFLRTIWRRTEG